MRRALILSFLILALPALSHAAAASANQYYLAGYKLFKAQRYPLAARYFAAAIKLNPNHWQAYRGLGHTFYKLGRAADALKMYEQSLRIHPEDPQLQAFVEKLRAALPPAAAAPAATPSPPPATVPVESATPFATPTPTSVEIPIVAEGTVPATAPMIPGAPEVPAGFIPIARFGFKAGALYSTYKPKGDIYLVTSYEAKREPVIGPLLGVFVEYPLSPSVSGIGEAFGAWKGYKYEDHLYDDLTERTGSLDIVETWKSGKVNVTYVHIPVYMRFYFTSKRTFHFDIGPTINFMASGRYQDTTRTEHTTTSGTVESTKNTSGQFRDLKRKEIGMIVGAGTAFNRITVDARVDLGVSNLVPYKELVGYSIKSQSIGIHIGYLMN